jgi:hypothetical protein
MSDLLLFENEVLLGFGGAVQTPCARNTLFAVLGVLCVLGGESLSSVAACES